MALPAPLPDKKRTAIFAAGVKKPNLAKGLAGKAGLPAMPRLPKLPFPYSGASMPLGVEPLDEDSNLKGNYDTEWAQSPAAKACRAAFTSAVLKPTVLALAQPSVRGLDRLERLDSDKPTVFVANHHSHLDAWLIATSLPPVWRKNLTVTAAADYFFDTHLKAAFSALAIGAVPLDRESAGRSAADMAASVLDDGRHLVIFPEGGRSRDGWGQPFKGGAAYLALRCGVPVVPIYLAGTGQVWKKGQTWPKPNRTAVIFGDVIRAEEKENTRRLNRRIESSVQSLRDEFATDWYSARKRLHAGQSPDLTGPKAESWRRAWTLSARTQKAKKPSWP